MSYNIAIKSQLDARELLLLDQEVKSQGKSVLVAYILWFFLAGFGAHRFYAKRKGSAIAMLILTLTLVGGIITAIWALVDAFLLHGIVKEENDKVEARILNELLSQKHFNNAMSR